MGKKYKLKLSKIVPNISLETLHNEKCFYGISINNPFTWGKHTKLFLEWISQNFAHCNVLIVDYLYRINEYISFGGNTQDAIDKSLLLGKIIEKRLNEDINKISSDKFTMIHWKDYIDSNPNFIKHINYLKSNFNNNERFQNNIRKISKLYVERLIKREESLFLTKEESINQSNSYIIEELAIISCLVESNYCVSIYPGTQLSILKEIAKGHFPELDTSLKNGIYIDLTVKKIK